MRGTRWMVMALALAVGAAACDGSGGHNADGQRDGGDKGAPADGPDAAAAGTQVSPAPPPVGTVNPVPGDTNTSITTPTTAPASDSGRVPEGNHPGATQGGQPKNGDS